MAASLRLTLVLGLGRYLLACSDAAPAEEARAAGSGTSVGGGATAAGPGTVGPSASSHLTATSSSTTGAGQAEGTGGASASSGTATNAGAGATGGSTATTANTSAGGAAGQDDSGATDAGGTSETGGLETFTLAVIGSSTAAGEGASSSSRGWVSLLANELDERVRGEFVARNLSVGGYATSNLMPGSDSNGNIDDAVDEAPNLVIVALAGSNDLSNGVSTETFFARLRAIRDSAAEAGVPVFFVSTAPKDLSNEEQQRLFEWTNQMREEFDTCWTPGVARHSPCLIDVFGALANSSLGIAEEYGSGDGIHLNDAGHQLIFEIAETIVRPYVCSVTACTQ